MTATQGDRKRTTLLFVDDEQSILDIAAEFFDFKGYRVVTARNGLEALAVLETDQVDCCFTDINMPHMDGLELAEHIRRTDNTIPVIVMTGFPSLDNTIQTLKNGVVDFLIKPVNLEQMELSVRRVLRQRQLFIENLLLRKEVEQKARLEKLNRELVYKVEELHLLNRIMSDFAAAGTTEDVFRHVVEMTLEVAHADQAHFYVVNDDVAHPLRVASAAGEPGAAEGDGGPGEQLIARVAREGTPLLIPEANGQEDRPAAMRSSMLVPLSIRSKVFGVLTASVDHKRFRFSEKDIYYLSFITRNAARSIENLALYENIYDNLFATLYAFVNALEARDVYTRQHSDRVAHLARLLGEALGCSPEELEVLNFSGHLHDIGKIGIRDAILLKRSELTPSEYEKIKAHPAIGANIVGQLGLWEKETAIIRSHHEHYDGTGYPDGLRGEQIPFLARVLAVADVFDAMASGRAYREKMDAPRVLAVIRGRAGTQFDPRVVETLASLFQAGRISTAPEN
jgi:putative nucleotidyltransferase with HDIG domain